MARKLQNNENIIIALATSSTIRDAAAKAGVSEKTIYQRLKDADFKRAYTDFKKALIEQSATALSLELSNAVRAMGDIVTDESVPAAVRLQAADAIIKDTLRMREHIQLTDDVERLKAMVFPNE